MYFIFEPILVKTGKSYYNNVIGVQRLICLPFAADCVSSAYSSHQCVFIFFESGEFI